MQERENKKTMIFLAVAAVALIFAWEPWRGSASVHSTSPVVGKELFEKFTDPLAATSLEVVRYDESNSSIHPFQVAKVNGVWSIPSHSNYPADAKEHMAQAATALMNLTILNEVSQKPGDQELYGVIAPDVQTLKAGSVGVGMQVRMKGADDSVLADLVIGKSVKDQPGQRYVRPTQRNQIYKVQLPTGQFSTKFDDWIEKDLLKLNAFDVREVELSEYSTEEGMGPGGRPVLGLNMRSHTKLAFNDAISKWALIEMNAFEEKGKRVPVDLEHDEELNSTKLDALKNALDDLKIVDVERKPKGLSQDLKVGEDFVKSNEAAESLMRIGFYPAQRPGGQLEIYSSEGEITCTTKDGVRYILRFGDLAGGPAEIAEKDEDGNEDPGKPKSNPSLNRYLFVSVAFDDSQIPKPIYENTAPAATGEPGTPASGTPATDTPAPGTSPEPAAPAENKAEEKAPEAKPDAPAPAAEEPPVSETKTADDEPAEAKPAQDPTAPAQAVPAQAPPAEPAAPVAPVDPVAPAQPADPPAGGSDPAQPGVTPAPMTLDTETLEFINRNNKRKEAEYEEALKKGKDKVQSLNERFADWYFIIPDDVFKKIHLGRTDIVRKKESTDPIPPVKVEEDSPLMDLNNLLKGIQQ